MLRGAVRRLWVGSKGREVAIWQRHNDMSLHSRWEQDNSFLPMGSAQALANHLIDLHTSHPMVRTVVELGAGCGFAGLSLARHCGINVILSDRRLSGDPILLDLLELSVAENAEAIERAAGSARVVELEWGRADQTEQVCRLIDTQKSRSCWIIGSEVTYDAKTIPNLVRTIQQLCASHPEDTVAIIAIDNGRPSSLSEMLQSEAECAGIHIEKRLAAPDGDCSFYHMHV
eukprot:m.456685 g.456685  ORF g.456685 m.456685 type:complete len:230 (+) comp21103_c0_seq1:68-757(+)